MTSKRIATLLTISLALTAGLSVYWQRNAKATSGHTTEPVAVTISVQDFRTRLLNPAENRLKAAESVFQGMEKTKLIRGNESEDFGNNAEEYAKLMMQAFDEAMSQAKTAADSQGRSGNATLVKEFEDLAKKHETRTKVLNTQANRIDAQIKENKITFDRIQLQRMNQSERTEYQNYLSPRGRTSIQKAHPDLFKATPKAGPGGGMALQRSSRNGIPINSFMGKGESLSATEPDSNSFEPTIEPIEPFTMYAAPCVGVCYAKQWSLCVACVVAAGPKAKAAYNTFVEEWNGSCSCKWYKPWCCAKKVYYLTKLIAKLA